MQCQEGHYSDANTQGDNGVLPIGFPECCNRPLVGKSNL